MARTKHPVNKKPQTIEDKKNALIAEMNEILESEKKEVLQELNDLLKKRGYSLAYKILVEAGRIPVADIFIVKTQDSGANGAPGILDKPDPKKEEK